MDSTTSDEGRGGDMNANTNVNTNADENLAEIMTSPSSSSREKKGKEREYTDTYGDTVPEYNTPLTHPLLLLNFEDRLVLVAKQILQYKHMYPLSPGIAALANDLLRNWNKFWFSCKLIALFYGVYIYFIVNWMHDALGSKLPN